MNDQPPQRRYEIDERGWLRTLEHDPSGERNVIPTPQWRVIRQESPQAWQARLGRLEAEDEKRRPFPLVDQPCRYDESQAGTHIGGIAQATVLPPEYCETIVPYPDGRKVEVKRNDEEAFVPLPPGGIPIHSPVTRQELAEVVREIMRDDGILGSPALDAMEMALRQGEDARSVYDDWPEALKPLDPPESKHGQ